MTGNERIINRFSEFVEAKAKAENRKLSVRILASELGVNPSTIQAWMNNTATRFDTAPLIAFCTYFGCEIGDLLQIER